MNVLYMERDKKGDASWGKRCTQIKKLGAPV